MLKTGWWCAVDMDPRRTEITLGTLDWRYRLPLRVESCNWRGCTDPGRVLRRVEVLERRYQIGIDTCVVTSRTPGPCIDELRPNRRVVTVNSEELEDVRQACHALGICSSGRRGVWLCCLALSRQSADPGRSTWTGWDWVYAGFCRQVRSLGAHLQSEGLGDPEMSGLAVDR